MIKVIAFDYGGVLGTESQAWKTTFKKVLENANISYDEIIQIWKNHRPKLETGKEKIDAYWIDVAKKQNIDPKKLSELYNNSITVDNQMLELAKSLKEKYKLVILSNDTKDWMDAKIKRFNLLDIFDQVYCSGNIGIAKPNKEIIDYVLNDLKIKPDELLFIDNQENNIESAKLLGIKTILFQNIETLREQLSEVLGNYLNIYA